MTERADRLHPREALDRLLAGNRRFARRDLRHDRPRPGQGRSRLPFALVITCLDGRVPVETAFDQRVGDVAAIRTGGHVFDRAVLASTEFAVQSLGVDVVLVLGHTGCAAVENATAAVRAGEAPRGGGVGRYLTEQIAAAAREAGPAASPADVVRAHVRRTVASLRAAIDPPHGDPEGFAGAVYDLATGRVTPLDAPPGHATPTGLRPPWAPAAPL